VLSINREKFGCRIFTLKRPRKKQKNVVLEGLAKGGRGIKVIL